MISMCRLFVLFVYCLLMAMADEQSSVQPLAQCSAFGTVFSLWHSVQHLAKSSARGYCTVFSIWLRARVFD
jgi:hypothetical protein